LLGVPRGSLFSATNRGLARNLTLLGLVTLLVLLAAWFGGDLLVLRQVRAMLSATRRLADGDLTARTGLSPKAGELNELAASFDHMAAALEQREAERRQGEEALRRSQEELRSLSAHLESVREEERTRLAREIHDELGQALTALKMDLSWLGKRLEPGQPPIEEKIRSMDALVGETIRTVQRLSGELRPGLLDDLGLAAAIEWQSEEFQKRAGIACALSQDLGGTVLGRDQATAIFRIFQETLTNVLRHAQATRVRVLLQSREGRLTLEVEDNGRGITPAEAEGARAFGLIGMRERVLALKGELAISGRPGQGTTVTVTVPLDERGNPP
jgi:signal transduction histidine kinase